MKNLIKAIDYLNEAIFPYLCIGLIICWLIAGVVA